MQCVLKMTTFCDTKSCSLIGLRFKGAYCLHNQGDDGGNTHFRNVGLLQRDYTAVYIRMLSSSYSPPWEHEMPVFICLAVRNGSKNVTYHSELTMLKIQVLLFSCGTSLIILLIVKGHFHILSRINTACFECWYTLSVRNVSFCQEHRHALLPKTSLHIDYMFFCRNCLLHLLEPLLLYTAVYVSFCEPGISVTTVWLRAGRPGVRSSIPGRSERIFPLASVSRPALGPIQPPVQWVLGGPFAGGKARPGRDADHSPLSSSEVENE
jgi:hypothetical protein